MLGLIQNHRKSRGSAARRAANPRQVDAGAGQPIGGHFSQGIVANFRNDRDASAEDRQVMRENRRRTSQREPKSLDQRFLFRFQQLG